MPRARDTRIEMEGLVVDLQRSAYFTVELDNGMHVLAHLCGRMRRRSFWVRQGDRVTVELSPYDPTRGRVVWLGQRRRLRDEGQAAADGSRLSGSDARRSDASSRPWRTNRRR
ncbi:MAG TPA: translation initiation factor IF-1 [Chloroflexota bacterium]|nr:translation initiation factor IF-1 [Chloroflexota bacterium]